MHISCTCSIFIADALSMPVHWYYDPNVLERDFGEITDYKVRVAYGTPASACDLATACCDGIFFLRGPYHKQRCSRSTRLSTRHAGCRRLHPAGCTCRLGVCITELTLPVLRLSLPTSVVLQAPRIKHPGSIMAVSNTGGHGRGDQSGRIVGELLLLLLLLLLLTP